MLWIPGPTEVRPAILEECARPMIGHRSAAMRALIARIDPGLRLAFGLPPDSTAHVAVHSVSATAMMEAALLRAGPRVLCLVNGAFSRRWFQIAEILGKDAHALEARWGEVVTEDALRRKLAEDGPFDAVTFVSSETSTGTLTRLDSVAEALSEHPDTLLFVDLVSYVAGAPVDFDANRLDFAFAGVQKAFALPPGISVACASERYLEHCRERPERSYNLDPVRFIEGHAERKTPATPCIPLYYALARQLEDITAGVTLREQDRELTGAAAWQARFDKHVRMRGATIAWAHSHGLELFPDEAHGSPTVSCVRADSIDAQALIAGLLERGFEIGGGYGALKGETFRIGHMGDHDEEGLARLLAAADEVLESMGS